METEINEVEKPKVLETFIDLSGEDELNEEDFSEVEGTSIDVNAGKKAINIVFIGHVDAGKSTLAGHIMYISGMVDDRTIEKYRREAALKNRESWFYAWCIDTNEEEREKGKTHECGLATFFTDNKRVSILDAPGHNAFVGHMIGGASQADIAVLVISARINEFEAGFEKAGQTREHAMLAKTAGVRSLVVVINKMDDPSVNWNRDRYDEIIEKLTPYLKNVGWNMNEVVFMPVSGLSGFNLKERSIVPCPAPWYTGPTLLEFIDSFRAPDRYFDRPVRFVVFDKYKDMGSTVLAGKVEAGVISPGDSLILMPNSNIVRVNSILVDTYELENGEPGDNVRLKVSGVEPEDVKSGFVLCSVGDHLPGSHLFDARLMILEYKSVISAGFSCVLHTHASVEEVTILKLHAIVDRKNTIIRKLPPFVRPGESVIARIECPSPLCIEPFKVFDRLGRFILRDEGKTIAVGVVTKLH